jgi:hypothetical protein
VGNSLTMHASAFRMLLLGWLRLVWGILTLIRRKSVCDFQGEDGLLQ